MSEYTSKQAREYLKTLPAKDRKLPKAFKRKWLEALRSGDYARTTGQLCKIEEKVSGETKVGYCCLGVAGVVLGCDTNKLGNHAVLNISHGVKQKVPKVLVSSHDNKVVDYLVYLNDTTRRKAGFKTIANWVEKYL